MFPRRSTSEMLRRARPAASADRPPIRSRWSRSSRAPSSRGDRVRGLGRYFGFVIGGALPASTRGGLARRRPGTRAPASPSSAPRVVGARGDRRRAGCKTCSACPPSASFAFVTGCQMAHVTALAAARHEASTQRGWDVASDGLAGAPPIRVVVGATRHVTVDPRVCGCSGSAAPAARRRDADDQGRMEPRRARARRSPSSAARRSSARRRAR